MTLPARPRWVHGAPLAVALVGTGLIVQSACKATPPSGSPAGQRAAAVESRAAPAGSSPTWRPAARPR
jgi:hypothetical protein